ncbi:GntR family transcriptional regulator [Nocardia sp. NBC_00565]|uniref:GntR family transcriptional regulator n=1 Tax=Nocardia sp. NBC_00565 TaxID=2975993 RepID=UPI002E80F25D|nr:GntR family transcriptional regulator [Nocardia sp. NBC_00565]WUC01625.1 GntR family transcriptional regulator [Nocardia sp. NBC_00565]
MTDEAARGPWPVGEVDDTGNGPRTERERLADALRERILAGELARDSRIDLDATAQEFGTSRTPVREACLVLAQEGLVRVAQRSGITVIGVSAEATLENFTLMAALSGVAAQWAAQKIVPRQLLRVRELHREIRIAAQVGDDVATLNWLFHREINRACGSARLQGMLGDAGRMVPRRFFELFPERVPCSIDDHELLVAALAKGDSVAARTITEEHFRAAAELLSARLAEQELGSSSG